MALFTKASISKILNFPASNTAIILGTVADNDYIKEFSALLTGNHH